MPSSFLLSLSSVASVPSLLFYLRMCPFPLSPPSLQPSYPISLSRPNSSFSFLSGFVINFLLVLFASIQECNALLPDLSWPPSQLMQPHSGPARFWRVALGLRRGIVEDWRSLLITPGVSLTVWDVLWVFWDVFSCESIGKHFLWAQTVLLKTSPEEREEKLGLIVVILMRWFWYCAMQPGLIKFSF